jgi:hypothetical protein
MHFPLLMLSVLQDMEQCSEFFRKNPRLGLDEAFSPELLLQRALRYKVTRSSLKQLEEERHLEVYVQLAECLCCRHNTLTFLVSCFLVSATSAAANAAFRGAPHAFSDSRA